MSGGRLIVVSGTGTGIGKTHVAEGLLLVLARLGARVAGVKPIETGLAEVNISDASRLERCSTFHVKPFGYSFAEAVSPHLAARETDTPIEIDVLLTEIKHAQSALDVLLVELAGGLFSPLSDDTVNADLARELKPDAMLLVAPDRLGVLHDVISAHRAAATSAAEIHGVVLVAPELPDGSTGRNAAELARIVDVPIIATIGRGAVHDLAMQSELRWLGERLAAAWTA